MLIMVKTSVKIEREEATVVGLSPFFRERAVVTPIKMPIIPERILNPLYFIYSEYMRVKLKIFLNRKPLSKRLL